MQKQCIALFPQRSEVSASLFALSVLQNWEWQCCVPTRCNTYAVLAVVICSYEISSEVKIEKCQNRLWRTFVTCSSFFLIYSRHIEVFACVKSVPRPRLFCEKATWLLLLSAKTVLIVLTSKTILSFSQPKVAVMLPNFCMQRQRKQCCISADRVKTLECRTWNTFSEIRFSYEEKRKQTSKWFCKNFHLLAISGCKNEICQYRRFST